MKYEDYIEKNIFKPLKMKSTGTFKDQTIRKNKAIGYSYKIDPKSYKYKYKYKYIKQSDEGWSHSYASGEICSTVEDLYRWNKALNEGKLINNKSLKEMFTPHLGDYGYGWFIEKDNNDKIVYHTGGLSGYSSYIGRDINEKYVIIILSNYHGSNSIETELSPSLLQILKDKN